MHPILLSLGPVKIYSFGVFLALAFTFGAFYVWREGRNEIEEESLFDAIVITVIFGLIGARLLYVFSHFETFHFNLLRWIHLYLYPGFSLWGGIIGGILGARWFAKRKKLSFRRVADFLALGVGLGQIFGQIGCFLDGCTVGKLTFLPWGMETIGHLGKRHPVDLYSTIVALIIFLAVFRIYWWIFIQKRQREGSAVLGYLILLSFSSFLLAFLKEGEIYFHGLSLNQWIALFFFSTSGNLYYWRSRNPKNDLLLLSVAIRSKIVVLGNKGKSIISNVIRKGGKK